MKKLFLLLAAIVTIMLGASAQTRTITGTVLSASDKEPLVGATVIPVGGGSGTSTDLDGHFTLHISAAVKELRVSYVGYNTLSVKPEPNMTILLQESDNRLDEVVVTGYGSGKKLGSVVGSVSVVGAQVFENSPTPTFVDALQGQVAGLSVLSNSGDPSSVNNSIRIRGVNSINASTTPLFILDGAPISSALFTTLNPGDIESITVLKDAASVAIYGSRAANGVIVITSKKGKFGMKGTATIRANIGWSEMVEDNVKMMNSEQYIKFRDLIGQSVSQDARDAWEKYGISTNWRDEIFDNSALFYSLEGVVQGGGENLSYFLSLQHMDQDGIIASSGMHRESLRASINANVNDWLKVGYSSNLGYTGYETNGFNSNSSNSVYNPAFAARMLYPFDSPNYYTINDNGQIEWGEKAKYYHYTGIIAPSWLIDIQKVHRKNVTANVVLYEQINPIKGLTLRAQQAVDGYDYRATQAVAPQENLNTPMGDFVNLSNSFTGNRSESFERYYSFTYTNTAEYRFTLNDIHHVSALVGQESIISKDESFGVTTSNQPDARLLLLTNGTEVTMSDISQSIARTVTNSWFFNASYDFKEKYFLDANLRRDGSSKFAPEHRWGTFWSLGAMWDAKKESFLQDVTWLDALKVRLSYGTSGNSGIDNYAYLGIIGNGSAYDGGSSLYFSQAPNYDLTWETVKGWDLGFNFSLINRFDIDVDFYTKKTCDMLLEIPYSYTTGFSGGYANIGSMQNKGVEVTLNAKILQNRDWFWTFRANFNYNKNKVTELFNGQDTYVMSDYGLCYQVGESIGQFYVVEFAGVDPIDGKQMWVDKNGNLTKTYNEEQDAKLMGKSQYAPWEGGFGTQVAWKGLSLQADFSWQSGKYMMNNDLYFVKNAAMGSSCNQMVDMLNVWTQPGDITDIPGPSETIQFDSRFIENASFLRMKTLTLMYQLPRKLINPLGLSNVAFHFTGRNLLTITNYSGYDPEPEYNISLFRYPNTRQYEFGVEISF